MFYYRVERTFLSINVVEIVASYAMASLAIVLVPIVLVVAD